MKILKSSNCRHMKQIGKQGSMRCDESDAVSKALIVKGPHKNPCPVFK